ncbi:hypothetical protein P7K49_028849 [Saguinus oedipus]|uniref:Uncharacterized protein n=1 Tax=Saguinus oedipus TaxID=9490 RepID=A0ABQ9U5J4_SAGOE|nr:hypothetical protein P7K49_028849 [Saguinus oedipus]
MSEDLWTAWPGSGPGSNGDVVADPEGIETVQAYYFGLGMWNAQKSSRQAQVCSPGAEVTALAEDAPLTRGSNGAHTSALVAPEPHQAVLQCLKN